MFALVFQTYSSNGGCFMVIYRCCRCRRRCRCRHCCFRKNLKNLQQKKTNKNQVSQARCIKAINSFRIKAVGPSSDEADAEDDSKAGRRPRLTYKLMRGSEMSLPKRSLYGMRRSNISYLFFQINKKKWIDVFEMTI